MAQNTPDLDVFYWHRETRDSVWAMPPLDRERSPEGLHLPADLDVPKGAHLEPPLPPPPQLPPPPPQPPPPDSSDAGARAGKIAELSRGKAAEDGAALEEAALRRLAAAREGLAADREKYVENEVRAYFPHVGGLSRGLREAAPASAGQSDPDSSRRPASEPEAEPRGEAPADSLHVHGRQASSGQASRQSGWRAHSHTGLSFYSWSSWTSLWSQDAVAEPMARLPLWGRWSFQGCVSELHKGFIWIAPTVCIEHPEIHRNRGRIFASRSDLPQYGNHKLMDVGTRVTFCLYIDRLGLGARNLQIHIQSTPAHEYEELGGGRQNVGLPEDSRIAVREAIDTLRQAELMNKRPECIAPPPHCCPLAPPCCPRPLDDDADDIWGEAHNELLRSALSQPHGFADLEGEIVDC